MPEDVGPIAEEFIESEYWDFEGDEDEYLNQLNRVDDPLDSWGASELYFKHEETGKRMYLIFEDKGYAEAFLMASFDENLPQPYEDDGPLGQLSDGIFEAYRKIEMEKGSQHTEDPSMIYPVKAHLPYEADRAEVEDTVEAVSEMTSEVEKVHETVTEGLSDIRKELQ